MTSGSSVAIQTELSGKDLVLEDKTAVTDNSIIKDVD
jgi:hypothetical protein